MGAYRNFAIDEYLAETRASIERTIADPGFRAALDGAVEVCVASLDCGGKILLAGNGGSAADAQHIAGEFVSRFYFDRPSLAAIALTVDSSVLTAIGNDYGYEQIFERQVHALGTKGDVFFAISTSGRSPNILRAIEAARRQQLRVIAMTGAGGLEMAAQADIAIVACSDETPHIQQIHIIAAHVICAAVEAALFVPALVEA